MPITKMSELVEEYRNLLDEIYAEVHIVGCSFEPSKILEELDPIAFRCGYLDYANSNGIDTETLEEDLN